MTHPVSHGAESREPFIYNGKPVAYTTIRRLKNGEVVYDFQGPRVNGKKPSRVTLKNMTPTDAFREIERRLPLTRDGKIGDRSIRLQPLYEDVLAKMRSGEYTHSGGRYSLRSIDLFEQRCESHVLPALHPSTRVADLKTAHLRELMKRLTAQGLSGSTVRGCLSAASALLRYAVEQSVIEHSPANNIGRGERPSSKRITEPRYLSIPQVEKLLAAMSDDSRPIATAMFWGALRVSEALELRWSDVSTDTLLVRGTKTEASADSIPLLPKLAAELRAHRERMGKLGFDRIAPDQLVFQTRSGKPVSRRNLLRAIHRAGDRAGLNPEGAQPVGCHDLRHSMAANALTFLSMTEASRLLRHANPQVTATVYADLTDDGMAALGEKLAAGFGS